MSTRGGGTECPIPPTQTSTVPDPARGEMVWARRGEEPDFAMGSLPSSYRARAQWTRGSYTMMEQIIAPRLLVAPHSHRYDDHLSYIVAGTLGFRVGDQEVELCAGDAVFRPRAQPHTLWNPTDEPAVMLEITSPGRLEDYIERLRALGAAGKADRAAVRELAARFGVTFFDDWTAELSQRHRVSPDPSFWQR